MNRTITLVALLPLALMAAPALAQTNVSSTNKYCWAENVGYLNWRDANGGAQGARLHATFLSGFIWGENIGWINLDHSQVFVEFLGCRADWNLDGVINSTDISAFLTSWLASLQNGDLAADYNNDGQVNSTDISAFLTGWLQAISGNCA